MAVGVATTRRPGGKAVRHALLVTTALSGAALLPTPAGALNIVVTNLNDSGAGSLRQAIIDINGTGDPANTITFSVQGTLALSSSLPTLTEPTNIDFSGPAASGSVFVTGTGFGVDFGAVGGTIVANGLHSYTGTTTLSAGTLQVGVPLDGSGNGTYNASRSLLSMAVGTTFDIPATRTATFANLTGSGTIQNDGTLTLFGVSGAASSQTFNGTIGGTGGLTMFGGGQTLTLGGATTYSGDTNLLASASFVTPGTFTATLAAGAANVFSPNSAFVMIGGATLRLNNFDQAIGSLDGGILGGVPLVDLGSGSLTTGGNNASTTYFGSITGTGGLSKVGTGVMTLQTADNLGIAATINYSGQTVVLGGTLRAGNANAFSANSAHALDAAGVLDLNNFNQTIASLAGDGGVLLGGGTLTIGGNNLNTVYGGVMSGTGGLTKNGTGVFILGGNNTYTGATTIAGGVLQANTANALSAVTALDLATGATFDLNSLDQRVGSLSGGGGIALGGAQLTVGGNHLSSNFSGVIAGTGGLAKNGVGTLTLSGANTFTGPTTVLSGNLLVNGVVPGTVDVNAGATLGGIGTVGNTTIAGTLSPGNSIGTITVAGNLTFGAGGTYLVGVSPTGADRTNVTGTATLAGTVNAAFLPGTYMQRSYTILSAGTRTGTFSTLTTTSLPANFAPSLRYEGNEVFLDLVSTIGALPGAGLNTNQRNVATALNTYFNNGGVLPPSFVSVFGLAGTSLANALSQLSGEVGTGAASAGLQGTGQFLGLMLDPFLENRVGGGGAPGGPALAFAAEPASQAALAYNAVVGKAPAMAVPEPRRWTVWAAGYGGHGSIDGSASIGSHELSARTGGLAAGVDYRFGHAVIGAAITGQSLSYSLAGGLGSGSGDAVHVGLYGSTNWANLYLSAAVSYGWHDLDTSRTVAAPGFADRLTADFSAHSLGGRIEGGYRFPVWASTGVTPYAALQAASFDTPAYAERSTLGVGGFALNYAGRTTTDVRTELGVRVDTRMALAPDALLILRGRAAWAHAFDDDRAINAVFQTLPGAGFTVFGASPARDAALLSAGAEIRFARGLSLLGKIDGEFSGSSQAYTGTGTLRYSW